MQGVNSGAVQLGTMKMKLLITAVMAVLFGVAAAQFATGDQGPGAAPAAWSHVYPVTYGDTVAFFDTTDGRLYVYEFGAMERCMGVRQVVELGKPLRRVKN